MHPNRQVVEKIQEYQNVSFFILLNKSSTQPMANPFLVFYFSTCQLPALWEETKNNFQKTCAYKALGTNSEG